MLVAVLEGVGTHPRALLDAVAAAESAVVARGREPDPAKREVVLCTRVGERPDSLAFRGWVTRWEPSDITGAPLPRYIATPWDTIVPLYRDGQPALVVRQPVGYLVPREWTAAVAVNLFEAQAPDGLTY
jgi:hypothetical protein